ncbi:uncharacterized protein LOC128394039 [Panonychus citri]|uniref:uncharacterized protein LOC128394039 n=1 Tax=Panonychus citri TaxID=50023 RepID=UPI0023077D77|nr:uncharacterized protein LOC128394039 [Panonychus citri]XP_053210249.1 uncharacterized protein LOC128394039 [Panonychus citri]
MSEYQSTLDLVANEESKISDCWIKDGKEIVINKQSNSVVKTNSHGKENNNLPQFDSNGEDEPKFRREKLPSIVEGDFSPLGITSLKQSFFAKIREARSKSSDKWTFLITFLRVTIGPCFWVLCLIVSLITPLLMFLIGSSLFNECPSHPSLPPLLIIIGLITCLGNLINIVDSFIGWKTILGFNRQNGDWTRIVIVTNITINTCDLLLTLILGSIIVFTSKPSTNYSDGGNYCNPLIYNLTCWFIYLITIYSGLIIILLAISLIVPKIINHLNVNQNSS